MFEWLLDFILLLPTVIYRILQPSGFACCLTRKSSCKTKALHLVTARVTPFVVITMQLLLPIFSLVVTTD